MTNQVIPRVEIREVCSTFSGGTPSRARPENYGSEHPWIKSGELNQRRIWSTSESISDAGFNSSSAKYVEPETNLVALYGATAGVVSKSMIRATINQAILAVVPRAASLNNEFLFYAMEYIMPLSLRNLQGAQPNLSGKIVNDLLIPHPPLPEQQKIAEILGASDEAIEAQERLIAQKQQRKKGLMQKLLTGDVRFPEFEGTNWKDVTLGEAFKERKEVKRDDLELLAVTGSGGVVRRDGLTRKDTSSEDKSKYKRVCPGDIAYNTMRMWQGVAGLSRYEGIVSPAYTILIPAENMDPTFASYFFKLPKVISLFHRYSQGLVKDTLNLKYQNFKVIKVTMPDKDEQLAIGRFLSACNEEITLQKKQLEQLKQQKKGLMQQLLTGKVRVKV